MSPMPIREKKQKKRIRKRNGMIRESMKTSLHESYYQTFTDRRQRRNNHNSRSILRNDPYQSGQRKRNDKTSMTRLLENSLEAIRNI